MEACYAPCAEWLRSPVPPCPLSSLLPCSGTSMATPVVAGVAALLFAAKPAATYTQVRQAPLPCACLELHSHVSRPLLEWPLEPAPFCWCAGTLCSTLWMRSPSCRSWCPQAGGSMPLARWRCCWGGRRRQCQPSHVRANAATCFRLCTSDRTVAAHLALPTASVPLPPCCLQMDSWRSPGLSTPSMWGKRGGA